MWAVRLPTADFGSLRGVYAYPRLGSTTDEGVDIRRPAAVGFVPRLQWRAFTSQLGETIDEASEDRSTRGRAGPPTPLYRSRATLTRNRPANVHVVVDGTGPCRENPPPAGTRVCSPSSSLSLPRSRPNSGTGTHWRESKPSDTDLINHITLYRRSAVAMRMPKRTFTEITSSNATQPIYPVNSLRKAISHASTHRTSVKMTKVLGRTI